MVKCLKFYTPTCPVCVQLSKMLDSFSKEAGEQMEIEEHNALESPLAAQYKVSSVPTLVLLRDGKEIGRTVAMTDKSTLRKIINGE